LQKWQVNIWHITEGSIMKLGFIGTGVITEAIITGLIKSDYPVADIFVSQRSNAVSGRLAKMNSKVCVLDDNQVIVDRSDMIFLAVLPQQAEQVLSSLKFGDHAQIVSLIATISIERLRGWSSATAPLSRVVPLPIVADHNGITTVFPPSKKVQEMFGHLGKVVPIETIEAFDAFVVASATMGLYFDTLETMAQWLCSKGANYDSARTYLATVYSGLAQTATTQHDLDFAALSTGHSTPNGLNQHVLEQFHTNGGPDAVLAAFKSVEARMKELSRA
jgi:pyrroline-5-carboxylate reductase